jgi:hypothetical protein
MSWAQENKFLAGLLGVTVVGVGVLGYLTWDAMSKYDAASQELEKTTAEKKRLETLPVYPNQANLDKLKKQKDEHAKRIEDLRKQLNGMELPEEAISPQGFQDRLRAAVTAYGKAAAEAGMKLPDKFYMGFDPYQTKTPDDKSTPKLARQLKAIEQVLGYLPQYRATSLKEIKRSELPEEGGKRPVAATPAPKAGTKKGAETAPLVVKQPFEIVFTSEQATLQNVLNAITATKNQFYIVRTIVVKNEKPTPPTREQAGAPAEGAAPPAEPAPAPAATPAPAPAAPAATPAAPAAPADPNAPPAPAPAPAAPPPSEATTGAILAVVGEEKVETTLLIEIAEFADLPDKDAKAKKKK